MVTAVQSRQGMLDLTALARRDLAAFWKILDRLPPAAVRDALMDVLPALGDTYGDAAATLAADYYDTAREAAGVSGSFSPVVAPGPGQARWEALSSWGVDPLFAAVPDSASALSLIGGGLQRSIADRHRLTVVDSATADPQASGWQRVGTGKTCGFCRMLIDRGHVYTESSVTFRSHDNCGCAASPSWAPNVTKISREPYLQSQSNRSDATKARDNKRARDYIADKYGT